MQLHVEPPMRRANRIAAHLRAAEPEFLIENNFVRHRWWRLRRPARKVFNFIGRVLIFIFEAMFDGGRMVREVGPGMRPLERHEFERNYRDEHGRNV